METANSIHTVTNDRLSAIHYKGGSAMKPGVKCRCFSDFIVEELTHSSDKSVRQPLRGSSGSGDIYLDILRVWIVNDCVLIGESQSGGTTWKTVNAGLALPLIREWLVRAQVHERDLPQVKAFLSDLWSASNAEFIMEDLPIKEVLADVLNPKTEGDE